jgi:cyclase
MTIRIIPRLEIKGPNLVKGIHLEGLRVLGSPQEFARYYYQDGADELLYMDVVASLYERNSLLDIVEKTSREIFIPLTVGGGIRSLDDIRKALLAGADKVSLNTAAIRRPELIKEAATCFGSSTIVISIEAKKQFNGSYEAYVDCGRERTGLDVFSWARRVEELGAGEILLTSIDQEGTRKGFNLELIKRVSKEANIPIIACGGAGEIHHVHDVITQADADAVCLSSILHYPFYQNKVIKGKTAFPVSAFSLDVSHKKDVTIEKIKNHLIARGVPCRYTKKEENCID